jgi:acyl carrier protein
MPDDGVSEVIEVVCRVGGIPALEAVQDFYDAGFTSVMALPLLMEMEERFQLTIPDERFVRARTARALREIVDSLKEVA